MTKPQVILDDGGKPAFAVIPWREYARLTMMDAEAGLSDEELYHHAKSVGGESFPIEVADRLLAGEKAVRVYREHRGMTQKQLASSVGINALYLSQIERGRRHRLGPYLVGPRRGARRRCGRPDLRGASSEPLTERTYLVPSDKGQPGRGRLALSHLGRLQECASATKILENQVRSALRPNQARADRRRT